MVKQENTLQISIKCNFRALHWLTNA